MKKYLIILILCLIALGNASYLSYEAYQIWFSGQTGLLGALPCDLSETLSCSGILSNTRSLIFGIPFPMIALVVYPVLAILALVGYLRHTHTEAKIISGLALGGMCFNGYVISQEIVVGAFCPLCLMCTAIIITIFFLSLSMWYHRPIAPAPLSTQK